MQETVAVAIEARKDTAAILQVKREVDDVSLSARAAAQAVNETAAAQTEAMGRVANVAKAESMAYAEAAARQGKAQREAAAAAQVMQGRMRQGAQAASSLAFAAQAAALGGKEAVMQVGMLATTAAQGTGKLALM